MLIGQLLGLPITSAGHATAVPDAQELRRKTRDAVVQLLTLRRHGGAGLILVEDFHWADPSTVEVVERIAGRIGNAPILLVVTSRTEAIRSGSAMTGASRFSALPTTTAAISPTPSWRDKQLPRQLLEQIVARSDGVPLFVEELAAAALETGQVDPGASASAVAGGHGVPSALYDSLMLRLERLGEAKTIAQLASVIGRSFSHQLWRRLRANSGNTLRTRSRAGCSSPG